MKLKCSVCGKTVEIVNLIKELKSIEKENLRWLAIRDSSNKDVLFAVLCGGHLKPTDEKKDNGCFFKFVEGKSEEFKKSIITDIFIPLKRVVPQDCISDEE